MTRAADLASFSPRASAQRGGAIVRLLALVFLVVFLLILYLARAPLLRAIAAARLRELPAGG